MISVPFELEQVEFGIHIPGIPLLEKSQRNAALESSLSTSGQYEFNILLQQMFVFRSNTN